MLNLTRYVYLNVCHGQCHESRLHDHWHRDTSVAVTTLKLSTLYFLPSLLLVVYLLAFLVLLPGPYHNSQYGRTFKMKQNNHYQDSS